MGVGDSSVRIFWKCSSNFISSASFWSKWLVKSILSVSNSGVIKGREPGETYVTYTNRGIAVTIKVIVLAPLESIFVTPKYIEMYVGDTCRLDVTYEPSNTTDDKTVIWSSSDSSVASVRKGVVTANKAGDAYITA